MQPPLETRVPGLDDGPVDVGYDPERRAFVIAARYAMLDGDLARRSTTLVARGAGTGKSLLGLHDLLDGARRGESVVVLSPGELAQRWIDGARGFGVDLVRAAQRYEIAAAGLRMLAKASLRTARKRSS